MGICTFPWHGLLPHFLRSSAWWLLLLIPLLIVLWRLAGRGRQRAIKTWLGVQAGLFLGPRRWIGRWLLVMSMVALFLAFAGPEWGTKTIIPSAQARDVIFLVDVSQSMLAEDRPPLSRLQRVKIALLQLLDHVQQRGDPTRLGIAIFAGNARFLCPPTEDLEHLRKVVAEMSPESFGPLGRLPDAQPSPAGTSFRRAVVLAAEWFKANPLDEPYTDLLLITDGDDVGDDLESAGKLAQENKLVIHTLGVGDSSRDWPIPQGSGFLMTMNHQTGVQERALTRRHDALLRAFAQSTVGRLILEESRSQPVVSWWQEEVTTQPARPLQSRARQVPVDRSWIFTGIGLLLLTLELTWGGARRREW